MFTVVSMTGKILRELYEQSNKIYGNHDNIFMTVGGMGHASMIALGLAKKKTDRRILCIDGDGAALMHMGALAFMASQEPENYLHIVINNRAHESGRAMPTGCQKIDFSRLAEDAGYVWTKRVNDLEQLCDALQEAKGKRGPMMLEVLVSLDARADLERPRESAQDNR